MVSFSRILPAVKIVSLALLGSLLTVKLAVANPPWYVLDILQKQQQAARDSERRAEQQRLWDRDHLPFDLKKGLHRFQVLTFMVQAPEQDCSLNDIKMSFGKAIYRSCGTYGNYAIYGTKEGVGRRIVLGKIEGDDIRPVVIVNADRKLGGEHEVKELAAVDWMNIQENLNDHAAH
jgi:hypothetical protein